MEHWPIESWPSPAKLNLFLYIVGRRADGYHQLQTLFQFLDYGDTLTFLPTKTTKSQLLSPLDNVKYEDNLIIKAANLLRSYTKTNHGVDIVLNKVLPIGGGIGGGSSNAATTLLVLNKLWQCHLSQQELMQLGVQLGADVPIFIYGHAAFANGIGEQLQPAFPEEKWYLVIHPGVSISTALVFNDPELKRNSLASDMETLMNRPFSNDCEPLVKKRYPKIEQLLTWLLKYSPARLTGTGACVFAEFSTEQEARALLQHIPENCQGFVAKGQNISSLKQKLIMLK